MLNTSCQQSKSKIRFLNCQTVKLSWIENFFRLNYGFHISAHVWKNPVRHEKIYRLETSKLQAGSMGTVNRRPPNKQGLNIVYAGI
jgi:hypothetical protein